MTLNPSQQVLADSGIPEQDKAAVSSYATFLMNTSPGWRPSDTMRRAVAEYQANPERILNRKNGSDPDTGVNPFAQKFGAMS